MGQHSLPPPLLLPLQQKPLGPAGGSISLSDGAVATFNADILNEATSVPITKLESPVTAIETGQAVSST